VVVVQNAFGTETLAVFERLSVCLPGAETAAEPR
jgi:hypothetical protein